MKYFLIYCTGENSPPVKLFNGQLSLNYPAKHSNSMYEVICIVDDIWDMV